MLSVSLYGIIYINKMKHLEEVEVGYFTHMYYAFTYSLKSAAASLIFLIHGIYPDTFTHMGYVLTKEIIDSIESFTKKKR
jgi:hypothetical protein